MLTLHTPGQAADWLRMHSSASLRSDSRCVQPGDALLAWPGATVDARANVATALTQGASACLVEQAGVAAYAFTDPRIATYAGLKQASAQIASHYFGEPSQQLAVIAVTGTNGKTSSAWWLAQALSQLQLSPPIPTAFVGTLGMGVVPHVVGAGLTTPDPVVLQGALRGFVDTGMAACAMEASSIGLQEHRLDGTRIHTAIFTNFTQDHLDYHGSMQAYGQAKAQLFAWPDLRAAVVNIDDPFGAVLAADLITQPLALWTVSMHAGPGNSARLQARHIRHNSQGICFDVHEGSEQFELATRLIGDYNVANLLGVLAAMRSLGVPLAAAVQACSELRPVPGRMECVGSAGQTLVAIDYAHTPDALAKALDALKPLAQARAGQLWCVFGCGGDRDSAKRPLMGAIAAGHADRVVVTSDNPRSEAMDTIISQILLGLVSVQGVAVEPDRARAIAKTLAQASSRDVVLIAGKGHEAYQEIAGQRLPFSDRVQVEQFFAQRAAAARPILSLQQVASWLPAAEPLGWDASQPIVIQRVHTDTRSIAPGDLFVALRGERFDANDFLAQAGEQGAVAALVQGSAAATLLAQTGLPGLRVADTRLALAQLATAYRAQFALPLIGVTGSNGKTTVTQMIASILRAWQGDAALATQGNLNNDIGVPLTLLRLKPWHRCAVVELGMNHPGEIATLAAIAQPNVALVNNAQREHLEFMQTVDAVAQENGSVITALPADGVAVFAADDAFCAVWTALAGSRRSLRFAARHQANADVFALQADWLGSAWQVRCASPAGDVRYTLHIAGAHNVKNSLAAVACALAAGVPLPAIEQGLCAFEPVKGRSRALTVRYQGRSITLVDDSYNANPDSVRAAIDVLAALPGPRLLVLGDMGEVGDQGAAFHAEALRHAAQNNIEKVLVTGSAFAQAATYSRAVQVVPEMADVLHAAVAALPAVASVLVKGSRFMKMERVVEAIVAAEKECTPC